MSSFEEGTSDYAMLDNEEMLQGADAQINLARGTVVTNAKIEAMPEDVAKVAAEFFGPDGRHGNDYTYFYNNIWDNVAKRVAAYMAVTI